MKEHTSSAIQAHLLRGAFYLLPLLVGCVIHFALGQKYVTGSSGGENRAGVESTPQLPMTSSNSGDPALGFVQVPQFPAGANFPKPKCGTLYDQYDNAATEPPLGIGSQQFEPASAALSDQAADDFVLVNAPLNYVIQGVNVMGEYSAGGGPASSFNVFFYTNGADNLPGTQIAAFLNLPYSGTPPNFEIDLGYGVYLVPGTYWLSVQAVQNFNPNGQWFWHDRIVQSNAGAAWQNPGDGYGTGCVAWERKNACMPDQVWPDQVFSLYGCVVPDTPTATPTSTPSATPTTTVTPTATVPPSPSPTPSEPSATPSAVPTGRPSPTPRLRPSPPPRR